tara:strand:+ start:440 stop:940 length:501 start_codon:yes stop_codon:yes gene_type:complete
MESALFKFKSSGKRRDARDLKAPERLSRPKAIGIKTPLTNIQGGTLFDTHSDPSIQLRDNMRNFLMTNHGERLGLPTFGADLSQLLFDLSSREDFVEVATKNIVEGASTFFPNVVIEDVQVVDLDRSEKFEVNMKSMAKVRLRVIFGVPVLRLTNIAVEVTLQTGG